ncbi:MAG: hypothetical protein MKZ80_06835 [Candidatus Nitrosopelagicus sp.]|nr:hypothetical protein [Candidatus Nitrosopelagicus sp.]
MSKISSLIGIVTIFFVSIGVISIVFPSLFSSVFGKFSTNLLPYEIGILGIPVILSNLVLLSFGILYYKKKLPSTISNSIDRIRIFEIPKKPTLIILLIIFSVYIGFSSQELSLNEAEEWGDYAILKSALEIWPYGESENIYVEEQNDRYVRMLLLDASQKIFQNIKILPFVASILVILFTYFLTVQITEKRLAGIIAILVLIQSHTFLRFDTVAVYENFWVLFYLLSIYVIKKQWILSPIFYILSFFTKAFVAPYFVMTLFFAGRTSISTKKKVFLLISYVAIIGISAIVIFSGDTIYPNVIQIDASKFFIGIATFGPLLRYDFLLLLTILPVVVGLTFLRKSHVKEVDSILFLILGTFIAGPILIIFTNFYEILPYRYIPFIIFYAIGVGILFSKKSNS